VVEVQLFLAPRGCPLVNTVFDIELHFMIE
jgi:hypothetical protein